MNYSGAAVIGAVSGLRSFSAPAIITSRLGSDRAAHIVEALAITELIADKLPFMPDRTQAGSLVFRALSGAACGYAIAYKEKGSDGQKWMSAFVGGSAALAASYIGFQFRKKVKLPGVVAALLEDAVAVGAGSLVAASIGH